MNTSLFGQSTPVNLNRTENSFLFGNTKTTPHSTPFLSSNLHGAPTINKPSPLETTTFHKHGSAVGLDKANKNTIQTSNHTKSSNDFSSDIYKDNQKCSSSSSKISTTTLPGSSSFLYDNKSFSKESKTFSFENNQPSTSTFTFGNSSSFFPTTTNISIPCDFSLSKPVITSSIRTSSVLFSTMHPSTTASFDLQSFRTMLNTRPFNNESTFLAKNNKTNINLDETRLRSTLDSSNIGQKSNLFSSVLTKPTVLSSINPLSIHSNKLPSNLSSSKSNKRKLVDSFIGDDDDNNNLSIMDDGPYSNNKISKINIKRPRTLDMHKIRSIVLGNNESNNETLFNKSSSLTSDNILGWKKFLTYDEYISSKKYDQQSFHLPKLTHNDYYTTPKIEELRSHFNEHGQCFVKQLTIGRKHYGSVTFQGSHMNLAGLDLDRIVEIGRRHVIVYPNEEDRPVEGEELNCQAIISLLGVYPIDRSISNGNEEITDPDRLINMNYRKYLEGITKKFHGQLIDYDVYTGTWTFQVEHF
ncbi:unnamed protein product [Rotaria sp. Silwood2]|nr:unnamed protein product [Rotaria sp. Silwood2]CAF2978622.1 unnamed protein product [Rotaria sp. Silwood2]CAF4321674.1 unnamed protein product [Rotaria sp. Silwood2]CAF4380368.1 unnamed protein product [Rotaria sp. Silwood2]